MVEESKTDSKTIITELDRNQFMDLLKVNPGLIIIKFTATWCGPCKNRTVCRGPIL